MTKATTACLENAVNYLKSVCEYKIEEIHGSWIIGPMKWLIYILGPNNEAKDLDSLLKQEYKNVNILVVHITSAMKKVK